MGIPTPRGSHAAPTVAPEVWQVPLVSPALATTQLDPPTHAVVTPRSQLCPTGTVVTHVLVASAHVIPRGQVTPDPARSHPSPSLPVAVQRPHCVPTCSQTLVAHCAAVPHAAPAPPAPTMAQGSVGVSMGCTTGPALHELAIVVAEAEHAVRNDCVIPLLGAPRFVVQSAARTALHPATVP